MTNEAIVGRLMSVDEAISFYERCVAAEKVMGPLSVEEKMSILKTVGNPITVEEIADLVGGKRILVIKDKPNSSL